MNIPLTIGIVSRSDIIWLMVDMCKTIKQKEMAATIICYVANNESALSHKKYVAEGAFDEVVDMSRHCDHQFISAVTNEEDIFTAARNLETIIGRTYNHLFMSWRTIGRGFNLTGTLHPRAPIEDNTSYPQMVNGMTALLNFWIGEIEQRNLGLLLNASREAYCACTAKGIPYRFLFSARIDNRWYWAANDYMEIPGLQRCYEDIGPVDDVVERVAPYLAEVEQRPIARNEWRVLFSALLGATKRSLYLRLRGRKTIHNYYYASNIAFIFRRFLTGRQIARKKWTRLKKLEGKTFVFFPLQTEPEMSIQWMSPEYICQLGAIASLARDLPAGVYLAVKESIYAVGRRPKGLYDQIAALPNVIMIDMAERGVDVIARATAVATISSTAGMEAAMLGKPVLVFGRHNQYDRFLPHVRAVRTEEEIKPALKWALSQVTPTESARRDGARFRKALIAASYDLGGHTQLNRRAYDNVVVNATLEALANSLHDGVFTQCDIATFHESHDLQFDVQVRDDLRHG